MTLTKNPDAAGIIGGGHASLGCELGSTRIKASLVGPDGEPLASGSFGWENRLEDGIWTYRMEDVWQGIAECFKDLSANVRKQYAVDVTHLAAVGFSAMMHGYIAVDKNDRLLVPFRTWRNTITADASEKLTKLFDWPIPQRWSIAHLFQAILNHEEHVRDVVRITTLAGYVHWKLTGEWAIGVGDASGMFPVDPETGDWDTVMLMTFDQHIAGLNFPWKLEDILPTIVPVGESAGKLTRSGARLLDPSGQLDTGITLCPPEGDAGTGMVVTNAIRPKTGNVSAGTSVFAMLVLDKKLSKAHSEIDLVLTPDGNLVGMAHSNNCTSDFNAWISLFGEAAKALGKEVSETELFNTLMPLALEGHADAGGAHHSVYTQGVTLDQVADFAEMAGVEMVVIGADTDIRGFKQELRSNAVYYHLNKGI